MEKRKPFFNLSLKFRSRYFIALVACVAAVTLYSILYHIIPQDSFYSGILMAVVISLIIGYGLGHLVMVFNKEMKQQVDINKAHDQAKSQLIYILSHDVKGPLNNINRLLKLVMEKNITRDELQEICLQLQQDTDSTLMLTQNLVRWIKIQKDDYAPKSEIQDVATMVEETRMLYASPSLNKQITINIEGEAELEVQTDGEMYKIVLRNLLSNAIKYSPFGASVTINYAIKDRQLITYVKDGGTGISNDRITQLLSPNDNVESKLGTNQEKGTGLGLQLCRNVVEKLNGEIWARSKVGKGSTFFYSLPVNHQPQSAK